MEELLLGVFFESTNNETNHLYVSFNGRTFWKLGIPYTNPKAFRDPGMMYYNDKYWILSGDLVKNSVLNKYQPKWGVSENLTGWSNILSGNTGTGNNPISLACVVGGQTKYPYDKDTQLVNKNFDACGPDVFWDGNNIWC